MIKKNAYEVQLSVFLKDCFIDSDIREELTLHIKDYINQKYHDNFLGVNINNIIELTVEEDERFKDSENLNKFRIGFK